MVGGQDVRDPAAAACAGSPAPQDELHLVGSMAPPNKDHNNHEFHHQHTTASSSSSSYSSAHVLGKREVGRGMSGQAAGHSAGSSTGIKAKLEEEVDLIADSTGMQTWQVVTFVSLISLGLLALIGWCAYRFFKKKRVGKDGEDGKGKPDVREDENALVENEEEDAKLDADKKPESEYLGKLQYELKYDFNTQTLMVKVVQESDER